jgi:hypothetical protein
MVCNTAREFDSPTLRHLEEPARLAEDAVLNTANAAARRGFESLRLRHYTRSNADESGFFRQGLAPLGTVGEWIAT